MVITADQRRLVFYIALSVLVFLLSSIAVEVAVPSGNARHLLIVTFAILLVLIIAALILGNLEEPKAWKHTFKPVRFDSHMVPFIKTYMDRDVIPGTWFGYQERLKIALWLREAIAENLELTWTGSISDFSSMLLRPEYHHYLSNKPALRKMLMDLQDVGVYKDGSLLYQRRKEFLILVNKVFKEVGGT